MGKNLQKLYGFRTDDELIKRLDRVALKEHRNRNKQIEYILDMYITDYEKREEREGKENVGTE